MTDEEVSSDDNNNEEKEKVSEIMSLLDRITARLDNKKQKIRFGFF